MTLGHSSISVGARLTTTVTRETEEVKAGGATAAARVATQVGDSTAAATVATQVGDSTEGPADMDTEGGNLPVLLANKPLKRMVGRGRPPTA
jgi:hypothetical protein